MILDLSSTAKPIREQVGFDNQIIQDFQTDFNAVYDLNDKGLITDREAAVIMKRLKSLINAYCNDDETKLWLKSMRNKAIELMKSPKTHIIQEGLMRLGGNRSHIKPRIKPAYRPLGPKE